MKKYNLRLIALSLILAVLSFITIPKTSLSVPLSTTSSILALIWIFSNYPGILLKDISEKINEDVAVIVMICMIFGIFAIVFFVTMESTEPLLIKYMDKAIWPTYYWYFFVMYMFPIVIAIYLLTRYILFLRRNN